MIEWQQHRIAVLETEVFSWRSWYWPDGRCSSQSKDDIALCCDAGTARTNAEAAKAIDLTNRGIDYSKWDSFEVTSSEPEPTEEDMLLEFYEDDYYWGLEREEETEEGICEGGAADGLETPDGSCCDFCEASLDHTLDCTLRSDMQQERIGMADEDEAEEEDGKIVADLSNLPDGDATPEPGEEMETQDAVILGLGTSEEEDECTESGELNKQLLLKDLQIAEQTVKESFLAAANGLVERGANPESLASLESSCIMQLAAFNQMLGDMHNSQLCRAGAGQLKHLIHQWQDHLLARLDALHHDRSIP